MGPRRSVIRASSLGGAPAMSSVPLELLADRLEPFPCPRKRLRLSPLVEAVQCALLFGDVPDPAGHASGLRRIACENRPRLRRLAERFLVTEGGVHFSPAFYEDVTNLDLYVAHYLPANVGKL